MLASLACLIVEVIVGGAGHLLDTRRLLEGSV